MRISKLASEVTAARCGATLLFSLFIRNCSA